MKIAAVLACDTSVKAKFLFYRSTGSAPEPWYRLDRFSRGKRSHCVFQCCVGVVSSDCVGSPLSGTGTTNIINELRYSKRKANTDERRRHRGMVGRKIV